MKKDKYKIILILIFIIAILTRIIFISKTNIATFQFDVGIQEDYTKPIEYEKLYKNSPLRSETRTSWRSKPMPWHLHPARRPLPYRQNWPASSESVPETAATPASIWPKSEIGSRPSGQSFFSP